MKISGLYLNEHGPTLYVKRTTFNVCGDEQIVYHVEVAGKPLCVYIHTVSYGDDDVEVHVDIDTWPAIMDWYFDSMRTYAYTEKVYHKELLHLFSGLQRYEEE